MGKRALSSATQSGIACSETNATVDVVPDPHEIDFYTRMDFSLDSANLT